METYIALLRGINVSGQKKIKMAELREQLNELPFENIQTYIQSGNLVFQTKETSTKAVESLIEEKVMSSFGFEVIVLVRKPEQVKLILDNVPFSEVDVEKLYYTFLKDTPTADLVTILTEVSYPPEQFKVDSDQIYFYSPNGYGKAKMNNNFFEKKLKVAASTRNRKTLVKLYEMTTLS